MKKCTQSSGATYGTDTCTDECGGYYNNGGTIDQFTYRYYIQGQYAAGNSCNAPGCPSPLSEYYPNTPICYRGCCPSGVTCYYSFVSACSGTYAVSFWQRAAKPHECNECCRMVTLAATLHLPPAATEPTEMGRTWRVASRRTLAHARAIRLHVCTHEFVGSFCSLDVLLQVPPVLTQIKIGHPTLAMR